VCHFANDCVDGADHEVDVDELWLINLLLFVCIALLLDENLSGSHLGQSSESHRRRLYCLWLPCHWQKGYAIRQLIDSG